MVAPLALQTLLIISYQKSQFAPLKECFFDDVCDGSMSWNWLFVFNYLTWEGKSNNKLIHRGTWEQYALNFLPQLYYRQSWYRIPFLQHHINLRWRLINFRWLCFLVPRTRCTDWMLMAIFSCLSCKLVIKRKERIVMQTSLTGIRKWSRVHVKRVKFMLLNLSCSCRDSQAYMIYGLVHCVRVLSYKLKSKFIIHVLCVAKL